MQMLFPWQDSCQNDSLPDPKFVLLQAVQSEYNRQFQWPTLPSAPAKLVAGCPSFKIHPDPEPPTQTVHTENIELGLRDEIGKD